MKEKKTKNIYSWPVWADLPEELLVKISKCLKYSFQVGHFRAVCTSWRSAVPFPPHKRPSIVPKYIPSLGSSLRQFHLVMKERPYP
ncbi:hypothetical protein H5410_008467 [Solanum commersonii]|uniref:F-box domain-containing protein n=1 Tax=Solanum commersonii TaxID=4109 RepID=A0A9J6AFQ9_SOLCO|nr:hypothetical protein H5410_008467 [Solanum commersonii]